MLTFNYKIGNLVEDVAEGTVIDWTPYGKKRTVTKTADNLTINYRYDATGNRVAKIVDKDGEVTTNRYIRDASGNVITVYRETEPLEHTTSTAAADWAWHQANRSPDS